MISPEKFYKLLNDNNINFFTGVPDSLLKDICAYITDNTPRDRNIIAANEGNAIGLAAGYYMATGNIPMVYLQNSGIGNTVNPLLSLTDKKVYNIPVLLMIGWRGEPNKKDEPQHITQGEVTLDLLEAMHIPYLVLEGDAEDIEEQLNTAINTIKTSGSSFAIVVRKGIFEKYLIKAKLESTYELSREDAIKIIVDQLDGSEVIVSTTGKTSRELFEYREELKQSHDKDFLTVGSMGHSSQIALGIAISKPDRKVICIDGDGAMLMHMGSMAIVGNLAPQNYLHIVINNGAHESVGGQPTVSFGIDIPAIAKANGYKFARLVSNHNELVNAIYNLKSDDYPALIEVRVKVGARDNLGRPTIKPADNKLDFMKNLEA